MRIDSPGQIPRDRMRIIVRTGGRRRSNIGCARERQTTAFVFAQQMEE